MYALQRAPTRMEYLRRLAMLRKTSRRAALYMDKLNHDKTFTYKLIEQGYRNHGHCTNNMAEIANSALLTARELAPYQGNNEILEWCGKQLFLKQKIVRQLEATKAILTPYASTFIKKQEIFAREEDMHVSELGGDVFLVKDNHFERGSR